MGLKRFIGFKLLTFIPMVFILLTFVFFTMRVLPGDPARALVGEEASEEYVKQVRAYLGLDRPIPEQYVNYMVNFFRGDLGKSIVHANRVDVSALVWQKARVTIQLASIAWVISFIGGLLVGVYASMKEGRVQDHMLRIGTLLLYSLPTFVLGLILQLIFGIYLGLLPIYGTQSEMYTVTIPRTTGFILVDTLFAANFTAFLDSVSHFILPSIVLATYYLAFSTRLTRSEMIKARRRMYCLLAEAKGLNERTIAFRHALRNALLPVLTLSGLQAVSLFTGSILVETVFSFDGLGYLVATAGAQRDYMILQGALAVFAVISLVFGLLVDLAYYYLDPRIRY